MRLIKADDAKDCLRMATLIYPAMDRHSDTLLKLVDKIPIIEAEPVRHGRWVDRYGGKYANPLYVCSECKEKALYDFTRDELGHKHIVQVLSAACPHCRAKMNGGAE